MHDKKIASLLLASLFLPAAVRAETISISQGNKSSFRALGTDGRLTCYESAGIRLFGESKKGIRVGGAFIAFSERDIERRDDDLERKVKQLQRQLDQLLVEKRQRPRKIADTQKQIAAANAALLNFTASLQACPPARTPVPPKPSPSPTPNPKPSPSPKPSPKPSPQPSATPTPPRPSPSPSAIPSPSPTPSDPGTEKDFVGQKLFTNPGNGSIVDLSGIRIHGDQNCIQLNPWPDPVEFGHKSEHAYPSCANTYPLSVKGTSSNFTLQNAHVVGDFDPRAPWHVWKGIADGDAVRVEGLNGVEVKNVAVQNLEDGFAPRTSNDTETNVIFHLHDSLFFTIHDDIVENDSTKNMLIENIFGSGHTFYSARGTPNPNAQIVVDHALIQLQLLPHMGRISGNTGQFSFNTAGGYPYPDGLGVGSILKLDSGGKSGKMLIKNSIFLVPRHSTSSNGAMGFETNNGVTYQNVTIVWLGTGNYPYPAPPGVTITRDRSVFDNAKIEFFAAHPQLLKYYTAQ